MLSRLILASGSPRRLELLQALRIPFEVYVPDVDESCSLPADEAVYELSRRKGAASVPFFPDDYILSADTLVSAEGRSLGKPHSREEAVAMLRFLSGKTHQVFTGMTVCSPGGGMLTSVDRSDVTFCDIPDEELNAYVDSGEPFDKAGGYAIQGRAGMWVSRMEGCSSAVIGLSLFLVRDLLLRSGFPLLETLKSID